MARTVVLHRWAIGLSALTLGLTGEQTASMGTVPIIRTVLLHHVASAIAIDGRLGRAFIATATTLPSGSPGPGAVVILDPQTGLLLSTIPVGGTPRSLVVDTAADTVFVATDESVSVFDERTGALVHTTSLPRQRDPVLAVDERVGHVVMASSAPATGPYTPLQGTVDVFDGRGGARLRTTTLRDGPAALAIDARSDHAFVSVQALKGNGDIAVFDTVSGRLVRTVPVGVDPRCVAVDTRTGRVFVINSGSASVGVLDAGSGTPLAAAPVGALPWALAVDEQTGRVFVANQSGPSTVSVLDATSGHLLRTVRAGANSTAVAVDARTSRVFVANGGVLHTSANINPSAGVSELNAASGTPLRTIPLSTAFIPRMVAVDEQAGRALVVSDVLGVSGSSAVSLLDATQ